MRFLLSKPYLLFRKYEYAFSFFCSHPGRLYLLKQIGLIRKIVPVLGNYGGYYSDTFLDSTTGEHEAKMGLDILRLAGLEANDRAANLCLSEEEKTFGKDCLKNHGFKSSPVMIHPSWTRLGYMKCLPYDVVLRLMNTFAEENIPCCLMLGTEEKAFLDYTGLKDISPENIIAEKISPRELASLVACSRAVISADSGVGHIAAAVGIKVITVWGSSSCSRSHTSGEIPAINIGGELPPYCRQCYEHLGSLAQCLIGQPCMRRNFTDAFFESTLAVVKKIEVYQG